MNASFGSAGDGAESLKPALIKSLIAHGVLALFLTVRAFFFPSEPLKLESAIRVDLVGLPEKSQTLPPINDEPKPDAPAAPPPPPATKELPPVAAAKEPPKAAPVVLKPTKPDPKKIRRDQDSALKRLEAMARLEKQAQADAAAKAINQAKNAAAAVRGNQVSKGNSLTGLTRLDHQRYLDELESRIKARWNPPKFLSRAGLRVRVVLMIDSNGGLMRKAVIQSSGNAVFDESAVAAIEESLPLPAPPETLHGILANQGVELDLEPSGMR